MPRPPLSLSCSRWYCTGVHKGGLNILLRCRATNGFCSSGKLRNYLSKEHSVAHPQPNRAKRLECAAMRRFFSGSQSFHVGKNLGKQKRRAAHALQTLREANCQRASLAARFFAGCAGSDFGLRTSVSHLRASVFICGFSSLPPVRWAAHSHGADIAPM